MMNKISWDDYFMTLAFVVAQRSPDPSTLHGCLLVDKHNKILSMGYNGPPAGLDDSQVPLTRPEKYDYFVHSEMNALLFCDDKDKIDRLYVTGHPCGNCMKHIAQAGVKKVFYGNIGSNMLDDNATKVVRHIAELAKIELVNLDNPINILNVLEHTMDYVSIRNMK